MDTKKHNTLLFVYNVPSGVVSALKDTAKKIAAPTSQTCNLCAVSYGVTGMKKEWREFLETLPMESVFLHKDEFHEQYPEYRDTPLPALFEQDDDGELAVLVSADELNTVKSINELKALVRKQIT